MTKYRYVGIIIPVLSFISFKLSDEIGNFTLIVIHLITMCGFIFQFYYIGKLRTKV